MADVLCPICGRPNGDHREFCDFCGNPLDGALRVEDNQSSPADDFLDSQSPESMDEASRLDSFFDTPDDELQPSQPADPVLDNGESRLDSFLSLEADPISPAAPQDPSSTDESRLDEYLSAEEPAAEIEPEPPAADESTRLGAYLTPEQAAEALPLDMDSLSGSEENGSSRLDEYLQPESSPEQEAPDESTRLDEFLADDPFKSPDPFREPTSKESSQKDPFSLEEDPFQEPPSESSQDSPAEPSPWDEFSYSEDDTQPATPFPDTSAEPEAQEPAPDQLGELPSSESEEPGQWDFLEPSSTPTEELESGQAVDPETWGFLDPTPAPEEPAAEQSSAAVDPEVWDFLEPEPDPDQAQEEQIQESSASEEWDFLDPTSAPQEPETKIDPESIDPGTWDYLDPAAGTDQPQEDPSPEPVDGGEWDFLDSQPEPDPASLEPSEAQEAGEWDFLDPPIPDGAEEEAGPGDVSSDSETTDDWSFLDPGPTQDLVDGPETQAQETGEVGEDAGWLDMLQDPGSRPEIDPDLSLPKEPQKPQTDWLEKIKRLNKSSDLVDEDSSFPDWLSVTGKTAEFKTEGGEESGDVPDWLNLDDDESLNEFLRKKDLGKDEYRPKFVTDPLDSDVVPEQEDAPASGLSDSQQIKFPSWAGEEKKKEGEPQPPQDTQKPAEALETPQAFQIEEEFFDDLFSEELPSWLTASSAGTEETSFGQNLAQGELPGWVEAMRPVVESTDASGLDEDDEYIENYGPLAGIPSVLPAEAEIGIDVEGAVQKPLDLLSTKKHKDYVELLNQLISAEEKSVTVTVPPRLQTQRVLRWLIAIIMLVSVAVTVIFSGTLDAEPLTASQIAGTGYSALYDEVETLYDGQPVLIAYDYQPAAAGELHIAAASVVDHLMEQGTFLTFISTEPTGPALAEHFLKTTQSHHQYKHTQKYINLGYLPGESAGLLSFTIAPEKIIPLAFDGSNAWDSPPLISVDGVQDFKMILVITDDPNTAKIWIEQVGSRLDRTPLVMVVSAQVEPLIQPYFRTSPRQVSGYVAGIIDSMNYEQLTERSYLSSRAWLPFNMGIVISVGIIFISGLANGVLSLFKQRKDFLTGDVN